MIHFVISDSMAIYSNKLGCNNLDLDVCQCPLESDLKTRLLGINCEITICVYSMSSVLAALSHLQVTRGASTWINCELL